MSFTVSGSGHCDTQEAFEGAVEAAKAATAAIGEHTNAPFYLSLQGSDAEHKAVSLTFGSDGSVTDHNATGNDTDAGNGDPTGEPGTT